MTEPQTPKRLDIVNLQTEDSTKVQIIALGTEACPPLFPPLSDLPVLPALPTRLLTWAPTPQPLPSPSYSCRNGNIP